MSADTYALLSRVAADALAAGATYDVTIAPDGEARVNVYPKETKPTTVHLELDTSSLSATIEEAIRDIDLRYS